MHRYEAIFRPWITVVAILLAAAAMIRTGLSQCANVNLLTREGWEDILRCGNVPESDWAQLTDCALDWIDADSEQRLNGAESDDPYYVAQGYAVSNAPLTTVTELLRVKGFDRTILYGGTNPSGITLTGIASRLTTWSTNGVCDCDGDGMPDWYEDGYAFLSPTNSDDGAHDEDTDLLSNAAEYEHGTNPTNNDTDSDRMFDGQEVLAGTDPNNSSSFLGMESLESGPSAPGNDAIVVQWQSVTGRTYRVSKATDLVLTAPFSSVATGITGQAQSTQFTDTMAAATGPYIYRVEAEARD